MRERYALLLCGLLLAWGTAQRIEAAEANAPVQQERAPVVRDSGGIIIVRNTVPRLDSAHAWQLAEEPELEIGGASATGQSALYVITSVIRLEDGGIVTVDGGSRELRFFDAEGAYLNATGGKGGGPGEFDFTPSLYLLPSDSLLAYDFLARRLTLFDVNGRLGRTIPLSGDDVAGGFTLLGRMSDGSFLASGGKNAMYLPGGDGVRRDAAWVFRMAPDGRSSGHVLDYEGSESIVSLGGTNTSGATFLRSRQAVFRGDGILLADNTDYQLSYYDMDGLLRRIARRAYTPQPVTRQEIDDFIEWFNHFPIPDFPSGMKLPKSRPTFDNVMADRAGNVWVQEARLKDQHGPIAWSVFDGKGEWVTDVVMPELFRPKDIGENYVLGVEKDDLDVESVRMYRLTKN